MKSCVNCAHCSDKKFASQCEGCQGGKHWEAKPMTHADRIRAMSDEKSAKWVVQFVLDCFVATGIKDFKEEKHGRWEYQWFDAYCSRCGYENRADTVTRIRSDPPFCPRCGAKMDGGTDNG